MQHAPARELLHFIKNSPTCYHVTENIRQKLLANGYTELSERERWEVVAPGGKYFVCRNGSSTIAFRVPEMIDGGFAMAAAHSDSPAFRLKEHPDRRSGAHYVQLSTEKYGGMLMSTWFDRPLSVAGRVFVRANGEIVEKLVSVDRDLLVIPNVAIHMNRTANDGMKYLANIDTLPLLSGKDSGGILPIVAKAADVAENDILGSDLFLYCRGEGRCLARTRSTSFLPSSTISSAPAAALRASLRRRRAEISLSAAFSTMKRSARPLSRVRVRRSCATRCAASPCASERTSRSSR